MIEAAQGATQVSSRVRQDGSRLQGGNGSDRIQQKLTAILPAPGWGQKERKTAAPEWTLWSLRINKKKESIVMQLKMQVQTVVKTISTAKTNSRFRRGDQRSRA